MPCIQAFVATAAAAARVVPCCGSMPVAGLITAGGRSPGTRYLTCSLCGTAWNHVRAVCISCEETRRLALQGIEGDDGAAKAETFELPILPASRLICLWPKRALRGMHPTPC